MSQTKSKTIDASVVVVGGGAAGMVAAYKIAKSGKKIILMEKASSLLESDFSKISGFMGCETKFQKDSGINIASKKNLYNYLTEWAKSDVNHKLISTLLDYNAEAVELVAEMGLTYSFYSDWVESDKREFYNDDITWGPLHLINEYGLDRSNAITNSLKDVGVEILFNCEASEVIMTDGAVTGIKGILNTDEIIEVNTEAVFLATGGFGNNKKMMQDQFNGAPLVNLGSKHNTGDGIRMALEAGAVMEQGTGLCCNEICGATNKHNGYLFDSEYRMYNDHLGFAIYGGLAVDKDGERFINEELMATNPLATNGIPALSVGPMYVIVDGEYYEGCCTQGIFEYLKRPDWDYGSHLFVPVLDRAKEQFAQAVNEGWAFKADSIAEIADHYKLKNLQETVSSYNKLCKAGEDKDFAKNDIFLNEIKEGFGYYAFEYSGSYWCTLGGIKTDSKLHALNSDDDIVSGIYIGGMEMGSAFGRTYYDIAATGSGLAIASGVVAADEIIKYIG